MASAARFAAVDLGASSGRVILGSVSKDAIDYEEVHRFGNGPVAREGGLYWDIGLLKSNVMQGLSKLSEFEVTSIGVDSWAVDYGLIDKGGKLVRDPHHYRDERNVRGVKIVEAKVSFDKLYGQVGLQFLPFNSLYQLAVDHSEQGALLDQSDKALLIPDLFNFWLCGSKVTERTIASTTGLLDPKTKSWHRGLINTLDLQERLLCEVVSEGTILGSVNQETVSVAGLNSSTKVVTVGSHDTASAFVAVPSTKPGSLIISSGTWSLLGVELDEPVLSETAQKANFTNEGGVDGRVRFLKNVTGLWLLQESIREWRATGKIHQIPKLIGQANTLPRRAVIDVDHERLASPGDMPKKIQEICRETGQWVPETEAEIVRTVIDSLVQKYVGVIAELETLTKTKIERIHIVGGGSQNDLLNQLTSNATGLEVLAGPVEATAIGNLVVQARTAGAISGSLDGLRALIAKNFEIRSFQPISRGEK